MSATGYPYIVKVPGVRAGHAIVEDTRIGVHDVIAFLKTGATIDEVPISYPSLNRAKVIACLAYYEDHRSEIDPLADEQLGEDVIPADLSKLGLP